MNKAFLRNKIFFTNGLFAKNIYIFIKKCNNSHGFINPNRVSMS